MKKLLAFTLSVLALLSLSFCATPAEKTAEEPLSESQTKNLEQGEAILGKFAAATLNGDVVDQSILTGHKLTVVNVWGTFCGPCRAEMPDLKAVSDAMKDKSVQIVGIVADVVDQNLRHDPETLALAKEIVKETGADFLHLIPSESLKEFAFSPQLPVSYLVDENGRQIGGEIIGSRSYSQWISLIETALENVK